MSIKQALLKNQYSFTLTAVVLVVQIWKLLLVPYSIAAGISQPFSICLSGNIRPSLFSFE